MQRSRNGAAGGGLTGLGLGVLAALFVAGCAWQAPGIAEIPGGRAPECCAYLETISAVADMGGAQIHPRISRAARQEVIRRAGVIEATHVEWLGEYPFAAAAIAWRCPP